MLISKRGMFHALYSLQTGLDVSGKSKLIQMLCGLDLGAFRETKPTRRERFLLPNLRGAPAQIRWKIRS